MKIISLISILLAGCASDPYFEVDLLYPFPFSTDYWVHPDQSWQCEPTVFMAEAGIEKNGWNIALHHESTVLCGSYNNKPEIYRNGIKVGKRWGGS